jgi:mRNA interferase MazF
MFERGDLLLVPFPFSDLSATKRRPVLALTDRIVTLNSSLVVKSVGRISERVVDAAVQRFCAHIGFAKLK